MMRRSTWILLLVFAVLVGFTILFQQYQAKKTVDTATATPTAAPVLVYDLEGVEVREVKISDSDGKMIDLYRDEVSSKWAILDVPDDQVDASKIKTVVDRLFSLQVRDVITQTPPLDTIGLISPAYHITMTLSGGVRVSTEVGSKTPIGSGYYVRVNSSQIVTVEKSVLDQVLQLISEPPLLPTPTSGATPGATLIPSDTAGNRGTPTP